jgi:hypothetical protein
MQDFARFLNLVAAELWAITVPSRLPLGYNDRKACRCVDAHELAYFEGDYIALKKAELRPVAWSA